MLRILAIGASAATLSLLALPASAACINASGLVTCSGTTNNFDTNEVVTVIVQPGATLSRSGKALKLRADGSVVINDGSINSSGNDGIDAEKDFTLINRGTITGGTGGDAVKAKSGANVTNHASIIATASSDSDGVQVGSNSSVRNLAGASISAGKHGINAGDEDDVNVDNAGSIQGDNEGIKFGNGKNNVVSNSGSINAGDKGIELGDDSSVINSGSIQGDWEGVEAGNNFSLSNTGSIRGRNDAVQAGTDASITNSGSIVSSDADSDAIDIDSGIVRNQAGGIIHSEGSAASAAGIDVDGGSGVGSLSIENHGRIEGQFGILVEKGETDPVGDPANLASQIVHNFNGGSIIGNGGIALDLGAGNDTLALYDGSTIGGDALLGEGEDLLHFVDASYSNSSGLGGIFDGGAGFDTARFGFASSALTGSSQYGELLYLVFGGSSGSLELRLNSFENFLFTDTSYNLNGILGAAGPAPTAVPVPPAALLMGSALAAFSFYRRRQNKAAA